MQLTKKNHSRKDVYKSNKSVECFEHLVWLSFSLNNIVLTSVYQVLKPYLSSSFEGKHEGMLSLWILPAHFGKRGFTGEDVLLRAIHKIRNTKFWFLTSPLPLPPLRNAKYFCVTRYAGDWILYNKILHV